MVTAIVCVVRSPSSTVMTQSAENGPMVHEWAMPATLVQVAEAMEHVLVIS